MKKFELIKFPKNDSVDIPTSLRNLADQIENGEYDDAHTLAWAIDCGDGRIELGLCGNCSEPSTTAYFLFGLAKYKLESIVS